MPGFGDAQKERVVALVGRTGCGKSTFARAMMLDGNLLKANIKMAEAKGIELPAVSARMGSCTKEPATYSIPPIDGVNYKVMDLMGLQDTDNEDKKTVEQMAKALPHLASLVGIVYIINNRMDPSEVEICQFLFNEFFAEVTPKDVLVVRSNCDEYEDFDEHEAKEYLSGKVSGTLVNAQWLAVDFGHKTPAHEGYELVQRVREVFARWTVPLKLSDKFKVASDYAPMHARLERTQKELATKQKGLDSLNEEMREIQNARALDAKEATEKQRKIGELQEVMKKAEQEKQQMYKDCREQEAAFKKLSDELTTQMENLRIQADEAREEKKLQEEELKAIRKESDEKTKYMIEKVQKLDECLEKAESRNKELHETLIQQQEVAQQRITEMQAGHQKSMEQMMAKIGDIRPRICSIM